MPSRTTREVSGDHLQNRRRKDFGTDIRENDAGDVDIFARYSIFRGHAIHYTVMQD